MNSNDHRDARYPDFDPDGANENDSVFGLPHTPEQAAIHLLPVPFEATTSYGRGTALGPRAILEASAQLDLHDRRYGDIWRPGIVMLDAPELPALDADSSISEIDAAGERICDITRAFTGRTLDAGKIPGVIGGEHAISLGGILEAADRGPLGILQIDAHFDLRDTYEGYQHSHASVMFNALERSGYIEKLVSVGIRDFSRGELDYAKSDRVATHFDADIQDDLAAGKTWAERVDRVLGDLPDRVWITFDIDGLDPSLCPHTGTPVPGGLSFQQAAGLLIALAESGKSVVGFDLVEVAPGSGSEWDANVGARMLYQLCGCLGLNHGLLEPARVR